MVSMWFKHEANLLVMIDLLNVMKEEGGDLAANYTREGEGHTDDDWFIDNDVVSKMCADFHNVLFETVVKWR